jgi:hypothetical protein
MKINAKIIKYKMYKGLIKKLKIFDK